MTRTYRRPRCSYDYPFALWAFDFCHVIARTAAVRQQLARFHSDKRAGYRLPPPRRFRRVNDRKLRLCNRVMLHKWIRLQNFEPLFFDTRRCPAWMPM